MKKIALISVALLIGLLAQSQIVKYDDTRLPAELISKIDNLKEENFSKFSKNGSEKTDYNGASVKIEYNAKYNNGYIIGLITILDRQTGAKIIEADLKLPFTYCCSHDPSHCSKSSEEIKDNITKHGCAGWKKVKVEE